MKNVLKTTLALALSLIFLVSCMGNGDKKHTHDDCEWVIDISGHYQNCSKENKKVNEGKHSLDKDNVCTVCSASIVAYNTTEVSILTFNRFDLPEAFNIYRKGMLVYTETYTYEIKDSVPISYKLTAEGNVLEEGKIILATDGEYTEGEKTVYYEDGSYKTTIYNEHGDRSSAKSYTSSGTLESSYRYENTYGKNNVLLKRVEYTNDILSEERVYEETSDGESRTVSCVYYYEGGETEELVMNEYGDTTSRKVYGKGGDLTSETVYEMTYDKNGDPLNRKAYEDSVFVYEYEYSYVTYDYASQKTYISKITYYYDDYKNVVLYNEDDRRIEEKRYENDGSVSRTYSYEYVLDKYGAVMQENAFRNDKPRYSYEYKYCEGSIYRTYESSYTYYYDDGTKTVENYDENGDVINTVDYDADGNVQCTYTYECTYDDLGNLLLEKCYENGFLAREEEYSYYPDDPSDTYNSKTTEYHEDYSKTVYEYDENGNTVSEKEYDTEGNLVSTLVDENTYDEKGNVIYLKRYTDGILTSEFEYAYRSDDPDSTYTLKAIWYYEDSSWSEVIYNEDGDILTDTRYNADSTKLVYIYEAENELKTRIYYDSDGNIVEKIDYEYEFDEKGNAIVSREYQSGVLSKENEYSYFTDDSEDMYISKTTYYYEYATNVYEYDQYGHTIKYTLYDKLNGVTSITEYVRVLDGDGNTLSCKKYIDGRLAEEYECLYHPEYPDTTYTSKKITYYTNGGKNVTEYDENGNITSDVYYDKDGNIEID